VRPSTFLSITAFLLDMTVCVIEDIAHKLDRSGL
jgi:hypothetical protein